MTIQVQILEDAPIVLIRHTTHQGGMNAETRRRVRADVHDFIAAQQGNAFVVADFSDADWTFAEQVQALGFMIDHFRELGGVEFLKQNITLLVVGDTDVSMTISEAITQEQYGGLAAQTFPTLDEALQMARSRV